MAETVQTTSAAADAAQLLAAIRPLERVAVAFSGGVDSTVVAKAAFLALGQQALAVTGDSPSLAAAERAAAVELAATIGIRHRLLPTAEFTQPAYAANDGTRCYHCKSELYDRLAEMRAEWGYSFILSGANVDDLGDYRPGLKAAAERGIRHPLQEVGLTKDRVRALARYWDLPNWDKPAAPCLASRLAIGVPATAANTARVEAAEAFLREMGFREFRVRYHPGDHARIEVPIDDLPRLVEPATRVAVVEALQNVGFKFVAVDLAGFKSGGLNVLLPEEIRDHA